MEPFEERRDTHLFTRRCAWAWAGEGAGVVTCACPRHWLTTRSAAPHWHSCASPLPPHPCLPRSRPHARSVGRAPEKREADGAADFSQLLHRDGSVFSVVYPRDLEQPE